MLICLNCKLEFKPKTNKSKPYCSKSCSTTFTNKQRPIRTENSRNKTKESLLLFNKSKVNKTNKKRINKINPKLFFPNYSKCRICELIYPTKSKRITCSKECLNTLYSIHRTNYLLNNGTSNNWTKRENFSYKNIKNIKIDSYLEKAAIVYLVDVLFCSKIERFKNIINFKDSEGHKRLFNPDFYVIINNEKYIVEVKMKWNNSYTHPYNIHINHKKSALASFCIRNGFQMLWLDFSHDIRFKKIYYQLKSKKWLI